jgi:acyl-CoA dehydrogenase
MPSCRGAGHRPPNGKITKKTVYRESISMDFNLSAAHAELQQRTRLFIEEQVIPMERDPRCTTHGPTDELRLELVAKARTAGLLSPHVSAEFGGLGLDHVGKAIVFEEAGYSPLGPVAMNIFAPDEGNMHMMEVICTPAQKERWLRPLAEGRIRSCFCMTEPPPGSGSDPSMLQTMAVRDGDHYVINGLKWLITGATGASFAIIMAKLEDGSATMFLSDMDAPGITVERQMDALDTCFVGGHGVVRFREYTRRARRGIQIRASASVTRTTDTLHALAGRGPPCARRGAALCRHASGVWQNAGSARRRGFHARR